MVVEVEVEVEEEWRGGDGDGLWCVVHGAWCMEKKCGKIYFLIFLLSCI